ncbi:aldo/keto reductase [Streptomyces sp. NPDC091217]|uniref:aldo/keto reductase n=1 Tax=Streptomyces sp. NPDC091217 TaxID=3365975 RepID=UPI003800176D
MRTRPLGPDGPDVAPLALGCAGMSDHTSPADEADAVTTIRTALDAGGDPRAGRLPRFLPGHLALVDRLRPLAEAHGFTVAQLAIARVMARGREHPTVVAVVGARRPHRVQDALAAAGLVLTDAELHAIDAAVPADAVAGTSCAAPLMAPLDSERGARPPATERGRLSAS